jgi:vacuolar-type H+-ATPase subunit C/Vma6
VIGTRQIDFHAFPPVGNDDWRYAYATGKVRAVAAQMLGEAVLAEAAAAADMRSCMEILAAGRYAFAQADADFAAIEAALLDRRSAARRLFAGLVEPLDEPFVRLLKTKSDFTNMRLGLRRVLAKKPPGTGYDDGGNVPPWRLAQVLEEERFESLPDYMHRAAEEAFAGYYREKDVRRIDYAVDAVEAEYTLRRARELESVFLSSLFMIKSDLANIRAVFRMRFSQNPQRVFLPGGYVEHKRFETALEADDAAAVRLFAATPYGRLVESGASYLASNGSFLRLEQQCDRYLDSFLKTTARITAGPQPVIAYLLRAESRVRMVRLILNAKRHCLEPRLVMDRLGI